MKLILLETEIKNKNLAFYSVYIEVYGLRLFFKRFIAFFGQVYSPLKGTLERRVYMPSQCIIAHELEVSALKASLSWLLCHFIYSTCISLIAIRTIT